MSNWKYTDKELPPENDHVLLCFEHVGISAYAIGYYAGDNIWMEIKGDNCDEPDEAPCMWMELPEIP